MRVVCCAVVFRFLDRRVRKPFVLRPLDHVPIRKWMIVQKSVAGTGVAMRLSYLSRIATARVYLQVCVCCSLSSWVHTPFIAPHLSLARDTIEAGIRQALSFEVHLLPHITLSLN